MKTLIAVLSFASSTALAQAPVPAAVFDPKIADAKQTITDLRTQLDLAQKQLKVVQGAQEQMQKTMSDAQAKLATCKAF